MEDNIIQQLLKNLNETGKHLLNQYYTCSFTNSSEEFKDLMKNMRCKWGLDYHDNSEDKLIIEYMNKIKEIDELRSSYGHILVNILECKNRYDKKIPDEIVEKRYADIFGAMAFKYFIESQKDYFMIKMVKQRYKDLYDNPYITNNTRYEQVNCFIFKVIRYN